MGEKQKGKAIKLDSNNLVVECLRNEYFKEEMPPFFQANELANKFLSIEKDILPLLDNKATYPVELQVYKDEISRRTISLPNIYSYICILLFIKDNWKTVKRLTSSSVSLSKISHIGKPNYNSFEKAFKKKFLRSIGYRYRIEVDIANCYSSIYTHSLTWAVCGKKNAKDIFLNVCKSDSLYKFADEFGKIIRLSKGQETNGILIGPFASRIYSELILCGIDKLLLGDGLNFVRYVDDFSFYFRTEQGAIEALPTIQKIFSEFNFSINKEKIKIKKFPYEQLVDFSKEFNKILSKQGCISLIRHALNLSQENKGALKYALKMINSDCLTVDNYIEMVNYLVNIMLIRPDLSKICMEILAGKIRKLDLISKVINSEIKNAIDNKKQQELLWFLYVIKVFGISIDVDLVRGIISSFSDDYSLIMILDIIKNQNELIYGKEKELVLEESFKIVSQKLLDCKYEGEHWLLLYENYYNKFISSKFLDYNKIYNKKDNIHKFFSLLRKNKINFYNNKIIK